MNAASLFIIVHVYPIHSGLGLGEQQCSVISHAAPMVWIEFGTNP